MAAKMQFDHFDHQEKLCKILGLNPDNVLSINIVCKPDELFRAEVEHYVTDEQAEKIVELCKGIGVDVRAVMPLNGAYSYRVKGDAGEVEAKFGTYAEMLDYLYRVDESDRRRQEERRAKTRNDMERFREAVKCQKEVKSNTRQTDTTEPNNNELAEELAICAVENSVSSGYCQTCGGERGEHRIGCKR